MKTVDLCRTHGISDAILYNWRTKYGGMEVSDARQKIKDWRQEYNDFRPHTELKNLTRYGGLVGKECCKGAQVLGVEQGDIAAHDLQGLVRPGGAAVGAVIGQGAVYVAD